MWWNMVIDVYAHIQTHTYTRSRQNKKWMDFRACVKFDFDRTDNHRTIFSIDTFFWTVYHFYDKNMMRKFVVVLWRLKKF